MQTQHASKSQEDYLETILLLKLKKGAVRSVDVATALGFSKPSISRAVALLRQNGLVTVDEDDRSIELTAAGYAAARRTYKKHRILRHFLLEVGATAEEAEKCGCEMEHILPEHLCDLIEAYLNRS